MAKEERQKKHFYIGNAMTYSDVSHLEEVIRLARINADKDDCTEILYEVSDREGNFSGSIKFWGYRLETDEEMATRIEQRTSSDARVLNNLRQAAKQFGYELTKREENGK
mgnify:CR=1 FL=1